jgi:hypothetical protein
MYELDPRSARRIIDSLRNSGQPPKLGASVLNVGTERFLNRLKTDYLEEHCAMFDGCDGGGSCKWIEADYGNGKTQFLRCVQEVAWTQNFVTAYVELSQDECPLDRPDRVFGAVARAIQARPERAGDVERTRGLDRTLSQLFDARFPGILSDAEPSEDLVSMGREWITSLRRTPVESKPLLIAAAEYLTAVLDRDEVRADLASLFLRGEAVPLPALRELGVFEKLDQSNGFRFLRTMTQIIQRAELAAGTVLLFDEARRTLSLMSSKSKSKACENLLSVINRCNSGDLPGTLFLYAVMPEFFTNFATAYPALQQRCGPATRINLNSLEGHSEQQLLIEIARKVTIVYDVAYDTSMLDKSFIEQNLATVADAALRETMGTGTRRLLVKSWVEHLDGIRDEIVQELSDDDGTLLIAGAVDALQYLEVADVESSGE